MKAILMQLLGKRASCAEISRYKHQKTRETEQFLRQRRATAKPQAPMGFVKRSSATYYLTSSHNHL
ncbi:hypothetical protein IT414_00315 [bacterium]|nr:hypothetical protein [bacterium]